MKWKTKVNVRARKLPLLINTMGWTAAQGKRLGLEKSILEKYFPNRVNWINPTSNTNAKIDASFESNSGRRYTMRVYIPNDFPSSCPNMVIKEPASRIPDFPNLRTSHAGPRNHEGYLLICHFDKSKWSGQHTLYEVLMKGRLWLEAYEGHLSTGNEIDYYLKHMGE